MDIVIDPSVSLLFPYKFYFLFVSYPLKNLSNFAKTFTLMFVDSDSTIENNSFCASKSSLVLMIFKIYPVQEDDIKT